MLSGDCLCDATCLDFNAGDSSSRISDQQGNSHDNREAHLAQVQRPSDGRNERPTRMEEEEWKKKKEKKTKQRGQTQGRRRSKGPALGRYEALH